MIAAIDLWLAPIPESLRPLAVEGLNKGDVIGFLCRADNLKALQSLGLYESAVLHALTSVRTNNRHVPTSMLSWLLSLADRDRLRAAGDALPGSGPFTLYRGVAGRGAPRRVRGMSWSADYKVARWFADRWALADPAVYRVTVPESRVLAYVNDRREGEFLVLLTGADRPSRCADGEDR